jgi:hypothetical protein
MGWKNDSFPNLLRRAASGQKGLAASMAPAATCNLRPPLGVGDVARRRVNLAFDSENMICDFEQLGYGLRQITKTPTS